MNAQGGYPNATTRQGRAISLRCGCWRGGGRCARRRRVADSHSSAASRSINRHGRRTCPTGLTVAVLAALGSPSSFLMSSSESSIADCCCCCSACWRTFGMLAHVRRTSTRAAWAPSVVGGRRRREGDGRKSPQSNASLQVLGAHDAHGPWCCRRPTSHGICQV